MDPLEQLSNGRLISLSAHDLTLEDILKIHNYPRRRCECCEGAAYHVVVQRRGWFTTVSHVKCGTCDENGMVAYIGFN